MIRALNRRLKRWFFQFEFEHMASAAARGDYNRAADIALALGETELMRRYEALQRIQLTIKQTSPIPDNPFARCSLEYRLRDQRRN